MKGQNHCDWPGPVSIWCRYVCTHFTFSVILTHPRVAVLKSLELFGWQHKVGIHFFLVQNGKSSLLNKNRCVRGVFSLPCSSTIIFAALFEFFSNYIVAWFSSGCMSVALNQSFLHFFIHFFLTVVLSFWMRPRALQGFSDVGNHTENKAGQLESWDVRVLRSACYPRTNDWITDVNILTYLLLSFFNRAEIL